MHHLYVVRTPLQLLSAYITAHQLPPAVNDLVLANVRGSELWYGGAVLSRVVGDRSVWAQTTTFGHNVARRSELFRLRQNLAAVKDRLTRLGPVDRVFLGTDKGFDNQLLVELSGNTTYARLDDGVWSYLSPPAPLPKRVKAVL